MGLDVTVYDLAGNEITTFGVGYATYTEIRFGVLRAMHGKKAVVAARQNTMNACNPFSTPRDPIPIPFKTVPKRDQDALELFMNHSDCDGEFDAKECEEIYRMLKRYRKRYTQKSQFETEFEMFRDGFKLAFKSGGKMVYH